jgi:hypothetical protein
MKRIVPLLLLVSLFTNAKLAQSKLEITEYNSMMHAIETHNLATAKNLIHHKINLSLTLDSRAAPKFITQAAYKGDLDLVKLLLANGADIEAMDGDMNTPLLLAIEQQHIPVVKFLLSHGADIEVTNKYSNSVLDLATNTNNQELINLISNK